jgi:predicted nucleic-acid-binding Zn-ribbon protein
MKCTQCGNESFLKRQRLPIEVNGDANLRYIDTELEGFICTKCSHIEWYDSWPLNHITELEELICETQLKIEETEKEIQQYELKYQQLNSDIDKLTSIISDENNTMKDAREASCKREILLKEKREVYDKEKVYYTLTNEQVNLRDQLTNANMELDKFKLLKV